VGPPYFFLLFNLDKFTVQRKSFFQLVGEGMGLADARMPLQFVWVDALVLGKWAHLVTCLRQE
jgi:hypothetical protein